MNNKELAETVFFTLECFWVLQEMDEAYRQNNKEVRVFLEHLYQSRLGKGRVVHPFLRLKTTLALLYVPISFIAGLSDDELNCFCTRQEHNIDFYKDGCKEVSPKSSDVLRTFRNSIAHLPDFAGGKKCKPNIVFDKGYMCCRARVGGKQTELVFLKQEGFVNFLKDITKFIRASARKLLEI